MVRYRETLHVPEQARANVKGHPVSNFVAVPDVRQVLEVSQDCSSHEDTDRQP
jgi:hypothetical protein